MLLLLLVLTLGSSAWGQPPPGWQAPHPPVTGPLAIGHAGSGFLTPFRPFNPLPPSSRRSIRRALARGADGVEVDVRLSQDSVAILYHDSQLESMTTGAGCVSQTSAQALTELDYRVRWPYRWFQPHERVRRLDSLLAYLHKRPGFPYLHLDLHEDDPCATNDAARDGALARQLQQLVQRYQVPPGRLTIISSRPAMLRHLGQLLPTVGLGLEVGDAGYATSMTELDSLPGVGAVVLHKKRMPSRPSVLPSCMRWGDRWWCLGGVRPGPWAGWWLLAPTPTKSITCGSCSARCAAGLQRRTKRPHKCRSGAGIFRGLH